MASYASRVLSSASRFNRAFRLVALLGLLLSVLPFTSTAHAQPASATLQGLSPKAACLQPPANVDLTTLTDAQLALYGLPLHPRAASGLAWWQNALRHARHRICTGIGKTRISVRPAFSGYANHAIWAGVVDTGSGYQAVNGNWYEPCITAYGHRTESDAWAWVGVGGAYSIVSNEGV